MTVPSVRNVLELGSGGGALLQAVRRRWAHAKLTSVDIDNRLGPYVKIARPDQHVISDVLSPQFNRAFRPYSRAFDAAVCNPPYRQAPWSTAFSKLLVDVGLKVAIPGQGDIAADIIFLAQNLRLLKDGGQLGIIVPDGTITGLKTRAFREALLESHSINSVIELPERIFAGTEAKTHILTLQKGTVHAGRVPLYRANESGVLSDPLFIERTAAAERMDYKFYALRSKAPSSSSRPLGSCREFSIMRGQVSVAESRRAGFSILHSTDMVHRTADGQLRIPVNLARQIQSGTGYIQAQPGDILITRVGRELESKLARVKSGTAIVSDCLYVIRGPRALLDKLWQSFTSAKGRAWFRAHSRGVCAKVLNKTDLLGYPAPCIL